MNHPVPDNAAPILSLWCPPARARHAKPGADHHCPGVAWVGYRPTETLPCTCPCHTPTEEAA